MASGWARRHEKLFPVSGSWLPGPVPFDTVLEGETEKGAYQYDHAQYCHALKRMRNCHGADDVPGDQELEPQDNRLSQFATLLAIHGGFVGCMPLREHPHRRQRETRQDRENPDRFHDYR